MERDLDFTRNLLFAIERSAPKLTYTELLPEYGIDLGASEDVDCKLRYHLCILKGAKYLDGLEMAPEMDDLCPFPDMPYPHLTWEGQEFLDTIRPQAVYEQVQSKVRGLGSASFEVVKALAVEVAKRQLGL